MTDYKNIEQHYNKADCERLSTDEIIEDFLINARTELQERIKTHPKQCSIIINYFGNLDNGE